MAADKRKGERGMFVADSKGLFLSHPKQRPKKKYSRSLAFRKTGEHQRPPFPWLTSAVGNGLDSVDRDKSVYESESTSVGVPSAEPKEFNGRQRLASPPDGTYTVKPTHAAMFWQITAHAAALATEL